MSFLGSAVLSVHLSGIHLSQKFENVNLEISPTLSKGVLGESLMLRPIDARVAETHSLLWI